MKKLLLLLTLTIAVQLVSAQQLPTIIPPSPQSQEFFKHFDFPEGNAYGTVNFKVPIYEIKSGSLNLPIDISYVSSGMKQNDVPNEIGYHWSLNAGGKISRTIYGKADDDLIHNNGFPDSIMNINSSEDPAINYGYIASMYYGANDGEHDIYSYSFGNTSGKFIYNGRNGVSETHFMPNKPYKADFGTIVDDKGITYIYNTEEWVNGNQIVGKLLNYIISADKKDTIKITYQSLPTQTSGGNSNQTGTVYDNFTSNPIYQAYQSIAYTNNYGMSHPINQYNVNAVKDITFKGGKITFTLNSAANAIEYIKVYDSKNVLIKQVQLTRNSGDFLTEVRFKDTNGTIQDKYSFEYGYGTKTSPDEYGYTGASNGGYVKQFNGAYSIDAKSEGPDQPYIEHQPWFMLGNPQNMIPGPTGILNKVTYPTGGTAEYSYEMNTARFPFYDSLNVYSGGLRPYLVKMTDNNGNIHFKRYRYGTNECGYGLKSLMLSANPAYRHLFTSYQNWVFPYAQTGGLSSYRMRVYTPGFLPEIAEVGMEATFYPEITIYEGTMDDNVGKTVNKYESYGSGSKYIYNSYQTYGSTLCCRTTPQIEEAPYDLAGSPSGHHITSFDLWKSFPLVESTVYKAIRPFGFIQYERVKKTVNNYDVNYAQIIPGMHIAQAVKGGGQTSDADAASLVPSYGINGLLYDNYFIKIAREDLASTTDTLYTPSGNLVTTANYEYNDNGQVSKVSKTESTTDTAITTYSYPADHSSAEPYTTMVNRNILSPVIEEKNYKNTLGNFLQATKNDYSFWDSVGLATSSIKNKILPKIVSTSKGNAGYEPRLEYIRYDNVGNVASVRKYGAPLVSYIWGYNKQYPLAEVKNAKVENIFHENFEEGEGNSSVNVARTGHYSKLTSYSKSLTGLDAGTYTLSYWKKQGSGAWTLKDSTVIVTGSTYTIGISGNLLDDVSFYPADAQMTTSTYDPLIGTTSSTDPRGNTTYYEYDAYNRLTTVRDHNLNVLKMYCYNYAGQQTGCPIDVSGPVSAAVTAGSFVTPNPLDAEWNLEAPPGYTLATANTTTINAAGNSGSNAGRFAYFATAKTASPETPVNGKVSFTAKGSGTIELQLIATWNASIVTRKTFALTSDYKNFTWSLPPLYANLEMMVGVIVNGGNASTQASVQFKDNFNLNLQQLNLSSDYKRFRADTSTLIGNVETEWYGWSNQYDTVRRKYLQHSAYARMRFKTSAKRIAIEYVRDLYDKIVVNKFPMLETQYNKYFDSGGNIVNGGYHAINVKTKVAAGKTYTISGLKTTSPVYVWFNSSGSPLGAPASPTNSGTSLAPVYQLTAPTGAVILGLLVQRTSDTTNFANPINDYYTVYTECMIEEGAIGATTPQGTIPTAFQLFSGYESSYVSGPAVFVNGQLYKYYQVEGNDWAKQLQFVADTLPAGEKIIEVIMPGQGAYKPHDPHVRRTGTFLRAVYLSNGGSTIYPAETKAPGSVVYIHDSIISGPSISSAPQNNVWMMKVKRDPAYGFTGDVFSEGYSGRILSDDIANGTLTTAFAQKLAKFGVDKYWFQVGVNDFGSKQPIKPFYEQYKSLVEQLHTLRPNARIYIQSTGPAIFEGSNSEMEDDTGSPAGPTANNFRDVQRAIATTHSYTEYVDFEGLFPPTIDNLGDGLHPSDNGNALYADGVRDKSTLLGNTLTPAAFAFYRNSERPFIKDVPGLYTITATGGKAPYTFAKTSGTLPAGLTFNSDGTITGTPTASGSVTIGVSVTDADAAVITGSVNIIVEPHPDIVVSPGQLLNGQVGVPYSKAFRGNFGYGPYALAVTSGSLPAGLSFNTATGVLSGTPTATGTSTFYVTATDHYEFEGTRPFKLTVGTTTPPVLKDTITFTATVAPNNHLMVTAHRKDNYSTGASAYVATYYTAPGQIELWFGGDNVDIMPGALRSAPVDVGAMALYPGSFSARVDNVITLPTTADGVDMVLGTSNLSLSTPYTSPMHYLTATASVNSSGHLIVQAHTSVTFDINIYVSVGAAIYQGSTTDWKGSSFSITAGNNDSAPIDLGALSSLSPGPFTTDVSILAIFPHGFDGKILSSNSPFTFNLTKP